MTLFRYSAAFALLALAPTMPATGHHGWGWATGEEFQIGGVARQVRNGNPHGTMILGTAQGNWTVEIGQPWRMERAGLTGAILKPGTRLTVHGHRSAKAGERLVKAERLVIGGKSYNLYPDRPS
nr:DUF6152 family protein [uncultured Sphingomonas sp.]